MRGVAYLSHSAPNPCAVRLLTVLSVNVGPISRCGREGQAYLVHSRSFTESWIAKNVKKPAVITVQYIVTVLESIALHTKPVRNATETVAPMVS